MKTRYALPALALSLALVGGACSSDDDDSEGSTATTEAPSSGESTSVDDASTEDLAMWQKDLNAVGCHAGATDGTPGPNTTAAIEAFQTAEGLTVDGKLGPQTEAALTTATAAGTTVCTEAAMVDVKPTTTTTAASSDTTAAASTATTTGPNGNQEQSLVRLVEERYVTVTSACTPPTYDGAVAGVDATISSFEVNTSAAGAATASWDGSPPSTGPDVTWTATYTGSTDVATGPWDITFDGACG